MAWDWRVYAAGIATASLSWGVFWSIYSRKTAPKQAVRTDREIRRSAMEEEGLLLVRAHALGVIQMADNLLEEYGRSPNLVATSRVAMKMLGRLRGLRESWQVYERDIKDKGVVRSYERLKMGETLAWYQGQLDDEAGRVHVAESLRRVEETRRHAQALDDKCEAAGAR